MKRQLNDAPDRPLSCRRRVLLIAAAFPPTGGPGVQRTAKFAKYLPSCGWRPIVWTRRRIDDLPEDATLLDDLPPELTVHRGEGESRARGARRWLRGLFPGESDSRILRAIDWRLTKWLAESPLPDDFASWAADGVDPLTRLIDEERVDALYSTFSPASNHLLALTLKRRTGLPWVADFRDLWTDDYRYQETSARRRDAHRRLEQEILEEADAVIGVTDRQTEILARHVPELSHKFITITNGFDPADFAAMLDSSAGTGRPFTLAHVGRFDRWRASEAWYSGLRKFINDFGADRHRFLLRVVGHVGEEVRRRLEATGACCAFTGYAAHAEAIREMRSADALLLCVPDGPNADSVVPAKLFEYLAARRPILVVGPPRGQSELMVRRCHAGLVANFDADAIHRALQHLYDKWSEGSPMSGSSTDDLAPFNRITLTQRLASLLESLVVGEAADQEPFAARPAEVSIA